MILQGTLDNKPALESLRALMDLRAPFAQPTLSMDMRLELEFREVPYFVVSRRVDTWSPELGDVNAVKIVSASEHGLVADARESAEGPQRLAFVPWTNIISLTCVAE